MARALWVLIAASGKPSLLARTLASLSTAAKPSIYRGTIVVENGPRCGIEAVVRGFPRRALLRHLYVPEANKSHALNTALARLSDGLAFMTDDDVRVDPHILTAYAEASRGVDCGQFYGGPVRVDAEHGLPPEWLRRFYPYTLVEPWELPHRECAFVKGQQFMGTNWAAFVDDLCWAGGFDTRLGPGGTTGAAGQETEMQRRLLLRGAASVYVPEAVAWHYLHRECLDQKWLLKRTYRHALEWGLRRTRDGQPASWHIVRGALGRLNAHAKAVLLRLLGGQERRFAAGFHEAKWRGRWDGLLLGRRWDSLPRLAPPAGERDVKRAA